MLLLKYDGSESKERIWKHILNYKSKLGIISNVLKHLTLIRQTLLNQLCFCSNTFYLVIVLLLKQIGRESKEIIWVEILY